jgi:hypothetical protein
MSFQKWFKVITTVLSLSFPCSKILSPPHFSLIQILTVLPNILTDIQKYFHKFLWNGKRDKIKREILTNSYEDGGLKMIDIKLFCQALNKVILFWRKYSSLDPCLEPIHIASVLSKFPFKPEHCEKRDSTCNEFSND